MGLVVETPWGRSAPFEYTVRELPRIASVSPPSGRPGDPVEIRGSGFGTDEGEVYLRLPGEGSPLVAAEVVGWQATSITVRVPPLDHFGGGGPLEVLVQTPVGRSGLAAFTLLEPEPPAIDAIAPEGRLLEPGQPLDLYDEEVTRTGARLTRVWQQGRAPDGSTHLWLGRRRDVGRGEGSSGLRFDAVERRPSG